jgi:glyoxylase-like metal-dependent hydrolase (beta-lactamase superfamily II)
VRLLKDVYLVGGGSFGGFGLTTGPDSHIYLVDTGSSLALIDCGFGASFDEVIGTVRADGLDPARIQHLFITHYHADHAGGAARYREKLGLKVAIAKEAQSALEAGDEDATAYAAAQRAGLYPTDIRLAPCPVDDPLDPANPSQTVGRLTITYVSTPGHCAGHGSYLVTGGERPLLFAGDSVFWAGQLLLQAIPDCDLGQSFSSVLRQEALDFDAFLPGHGAITLKGGRQHVEAAAKTIRNLGVPRNIV